MEWPWPYVREHFDPFVPDEARLWRLEPKSLDLNRAENATVAIVHCEVMNIYGADRIGEDYTGITGIEAVVAVDLKCMKPVGQAFYSGGKLITLEEERLVLGEFDLAGISDDGSVMVWNTYGGGAQVWAFPEPGVMLRNAVSDSSVDGVRRDGNALLTRPKVSKKGDTIQEILLDWQFGPACGDGGPTEGMTEEDFYAVIERKKPAPPADASVSTETPSAASMPVDEAVAPTAQAEDAAPEVIYRRGDVAGGRYEVLSDAMTGGMNRVWHVRERDTGEELAMIRPSTPRGRGSGAAWQRFQEVFSLQQRLEPSGIVTCRAQAELDGVPTAFCEWMGGGSLKQRIDDRSLFAGEEVSVQARAMDIALQSARALQHIHEQGVVHGDVKPANIMLTAGGEVRIADFGLSGRIGGKSVGFTRAYCPAEQAEVAPLKPWMDVYAWGLTLLEMLLGKRPWTTGDEAARRFEEFVEDAKLPEGMRTIPRRCIVERVNGFSDVMPLLSTLSALSKLAAQTPKRPPKAPPKKLQSDVSAADRQALERLKAEWDEANAQSDVCCEAFSREEARWNSRERAQLDADIERKQSALNHLGLFGFTKKKRLTAELDALEKRRAEWFAAHREARERWDEAVKRATAAQTAYEALKKRVSGKK